MPEWDAATAEWYAEKYGEYATNRLGIEELRKLTPTTVLDIGCGTGAALRHASTIWANASFVGVDPVPRMVEIAREHTRAHSRPVDITFHVAGAESLPFDNDVFDLVLAFDSMDHWSDRAAGLSEASRVLKTGGHLALVKDGGVPGTSTEIDDATQALHHLRLKMQKSVTQDDVSFAIWLFAKA